MSLCAVQLFVLVYFQIIFAQPEDVACSYIEYGRSCLLQTKPGVMKIIDDQLLVGTSNSLHVFFPQVDLDYSESIDLSSDEQTVENCVGFGPGQLGFTSSTCKNFIQIIEFFPDESEDGKIMVCGSNAYLPRCTLHMRYLLSNYTKLSAPGVIDAGYSGHVDVHRIVAILASNGRFFSGTTFDSAGTRVTLRMSPGTLQGNTTFTVGSRPSDPQWLNRPAFKSVYEYGEYIYFFMTETPYEISMPGNTIYSRTIRICKSDNGINSSRSVDFNNFLTFQKARLECSFGATNPFVYNGLESTFRLDQSDDGTPVLYGTFNSPLNGPPGGAVCKFSFNSEDTGSITNIFKSTKNRILVNNNWISRSSNTAYTCPGTSGPQRSVQDSQLHILKYDSITPIQDQPVFVSNIEFLDKVAVEKLTYGEDIQEIIYYTNRQGDIKQVVLSSENVGMEYKHTLYEGGGNRIIQLILHLSIDSSTIIASANRHILHFPRGQCFCYTDCFSCLDSRDAYCGWETKTEACVNKLVFGELPTIIQSAIASEMDITRTCGASSQIAIFPCSPRTTSTPEPDAETTTPMHTQTVLVQTTSSSTLATINDTYTVSIPTKDPAKAVESIQDTSLYVIGGLGTVSLLLLLVVAIALIVGLFVSVRTSKACA